MKASTQSNGKKGVTLAGTRISEQAAKGFDKALKHYRVKKPDFCRLCIDTLIERYYAGDSFEAVFTVPLGEEEAKEYKAALEHYHLRRIDFALMCIHRLIEDYQAGEPVSLPIAFEKGAKRKTRRQAN
jgi:hypothetical protein